LQDSADPLRDYYFFGTFPTENRTSEELESTLTTFILLARWKVGLFIAIIIKL